MLSPDRISLAAVAGDHVVVFDLKEGSGQVVPNPPGVRAWGLFGGTGPSFGVMSIELRNGTVLRHLSSRTFAEPATETARVVVHGGAVEEAAGDLASLAAVVPTLGLSWPWVARFGPAGVSIDDISASVPDIWDEDPEDGTSFVTSPDGTLLLIRRARSGGRFIVYDTAQSRPVGDLDFAYGRTIFRFAGVPPAALWLADQRCVYRLDPASGNIERSALITDRPIRCYISGLAVDEAAGDVVVRVHHRGWQAPVLYVLLSAETLQLRGAATVSQPPPTFELHDGMVLEAMPSDPPALRFTNPGRGIDPAAPYRIDVDGWPRCG